MVPSIKDEKILSYNDVVLRRSDLDILGGPHFINDRIIEFYFSYLHESLPNLSNKVLLVPPSISFWIANCPDSQSLCEAVNPLGLQDKELVVFTVNDNVDLSLAEGGTHWSVLVYDREMNAFVHHDSSVLNGWHARRLYKAVKGFVGVGAESRKDVSFVEGFTPRQRNGYDCGLYVMAIARVVCEWYQSGSRNGEEKWFAALKEEVSDVAVAKMRGQVLNLILGLMAKK